MYIKRVVWVSSFYLSYSFRLEFVFLAMVGFFLEWPLCLLKLDACLRISYSKVYLCVYIVEYITTGMKRNTAIVCA